jgi:hypothetical protein
MFVKKSLLLCITIYLFCLAPVFSIDINSIKKYQNDETQDDDYFNDDETEDDDDGPPIVTDWNPFNFQLFQKGNFVFNINIGALFPLPSIGPNGKLPYKFSPPIGVSGELSVSYFLTDHIYTGGGLSGAFQKTISNEYLYIVPLGIHAGYAFTVGRFEFPLQLGLGMAWQIYESHLYVGMFLKPQAGVQFRAFDDWSFGLHANYMMLPQTGTRDGKSGPKTPVKDAFGQFMTVSLVAQYHF